jgi:hypothetical protein
MDYLLLPLNLTARTSPVINVNNPTKMNASEKNLKGSNLIKESEE